VFHVEQIFPREEEKRVAKIVAIANQKGGVGKTTTAVNLSSCVAALGKKVLIVDLDPQGNTTTGYGIPKRSVEAGTYEVLIGRAKAGPGNPPPDDIAAKAQADTMANTALLQSGLSGMNDWWTPAETFGKALVNKEITKDNAAAKYQDWVKQAGGKIAE